jgi:ADP-ribosyl-[dinitrogen reductase] hydrolase
MTAAQLKRFKSAVWGFVIGDALGVPYEFSTREEMAASPITGMIGFKSHNQEAGSWSDDSSMMLCLLSWLIEEGVKSDDYWLHAGRQQQHKLASKFLDWYQKGNYTSSGCLFDIGITTQKAIENFASGKPVQDCGINIEKVACGNGSLMRVLPIALFFIDKKISMRFLMVSRTGSITHNTQLTAHCSLFYVELLVKLLNGFNKQDALKHARAALSYVFRQTDEIYEDTNLQPWKRIFKSDFIKLPQESIHSGTYVIDTLEAVIWTFMNTKSYTEAVLASINLGGDTDTIGALTGGLAGCYYEGGIPGKWIRKVLNKAFIDSILDKIT